MKKICIIKLGALGDVTRTLPILIGIKEKFPNSEICWITKKNALEIVKDSPQVNKVYTLPFETKEKFDILYNFDIEDEATILAKNISANEKYGFYSKDGFAYGFNLGAEYYLNTLFDDETKKINKKTYQEMMFDLAELQYNKQHHPIYFSENDKSYAQNFIKENSLNTLRLIGIHIGADSRWPSKIWHKEELKKFILKAKSQGYEIILFGGANEIEKQKKLKKDLDDKGIKIYVNNPNNTIKQFASLVDICKIMVCSDSLALHVSLAMKKQTIGLFFCTPPNEIESYGLLRKLVSPMLYDFFPEKMDQYDEKLVKSISVDKVMTNLNSIIGKITINLDYKNT